MVKVRGNSVLGRIDARSAQHGPNVTKRSTGVWRVHRGDRTLGWLRYVGQSRCAYALYFDGADEAGNQAWCRSFDSFDSGVAWALQHAAELVIRARELGPSVIRELDR